MKKAAQKNYLWFIAGVVFAILWASASAATKIGLTVAQPLMIAVIRFGIAAAIMLFWTHIIRKNRLPKQVEWKQLIIYGLLNITIYLGLYVVAMQNVTAGIGSLAVGTNPVFISFLSVIFLNKKLTFPVIAAIVLGVCGVAVASWPLLTDASVTPAGLILLLISMLSYSAGAIYFSGKQWNNLPLFTINGWQTLLGGLFLLPFALFFYDGGQNAFAGTFWKNVLWLAVPVSIGAAQLWLWLLRQNPVRAGLWLFLCPPIGFIIASLILDDPIDTYTYTGVALVIAGLLLARIYGKKT